MFWYIDPSHTAVNFSVKHMMLSTVRGSLGKVRGRIEVDPEQPEKGDFEVAAAVRGSIQAMPSAMATSSQPTSSTRRSTRR